MTSTAEPDYWSLLGVDSDCTDQQLKRAFRREARRWHPDLNSNDPVAEERFKLVNEAYAVLSDPAGVRPGREGVVPVRMLPTPLPRASLILRITSM